MFYNMILHILRLFLFFFFNDTATTEIYTLSLHDALPISGFARDGETRDISRGPLLSSESISNPRPGPAAPQDRKSTRLNSSHGYISYAVFCLKKKNDKIFPNKIANCDSSVVNCLVVFTCA